MDVVVAGSTEDNVIHSASLDSIVSSNQRIRGDDFDNQFVRIEGCKSIVAEHVVNGLISARLEQIIGIAT